ncbi:MAG TPA: hypothetical protein VN901_06560 [Candidatus Acidoferrales bacterium]|nr:hypothetical protein [Candidatus Acidoferrales bacterium]
MSNNHESARHHHSPTVGKHWTKLLVYVALVFIWIYAIPGWVAYRGHAFTAAQIAPLLHGQAKRDWDQYQVALHNLQNCVAVEDVGLANPTIDQSRLAGLLSVQRACSSLLSEEKPPLTLAGFIGNWLLEIWIISYLGLLMLVSQWSSRPESRVNWLRMVSLGLCLYIAFNWSSWIRNFGLTEVANGRRVFSFVNWDISHASFALQELRVLGMMILLGLLWERYSGVCSHLEQELAIRSSRAISANGLIDDEMLYRNTLQSWQTTSIVLAVTFMPWGYFYWRKIQEHHDIRYFPSAVTIQLIWLATWYLSSRPLLIVSTWWRRRKLLTLSAKDDALETFKSIIGTAENSSEWQVLGAAIAAAASLIIPIIRALFHGS